MARLGGYNMNAYYTLLQFVAADYDKGKPKEAQIPLVDNPPAAEDSEQITFPE